MLLTYHHVIAKVLRDSRLVTFYFYRDQIKDLMELWLTGQPLPVSDIREVFRAGRIFEQVVHGEI